MLIEHEEWRSVVGFAGIYEVSDKGRVRSLDRVATYSRVDQYSGRTLTIRRKHAGRLLRLGRQSSGHMSVALGKEAGSKLVHVLVLEAFIGPCPAGHESLHKDGNPSQNLLTNLRWGTRSENLLDAVAHGVKPVGSKHPSARLREQDIPLIRKASRGPRGCVARLARAYGIAESVIRSIRDGKSWKHVEAAPCL